jgi:Na+/phosphate symporter
VVIYFSLLVALIGLVVYMVATNGKAQEIGRLMFACGLLAFLLAFPGILHAPVLR